MLANERIADIRAKLNNAIYALESITNPIRLPTWNTLCFVLNDIPVLLDALAAETARADEAEADRDHWKARHKELIQKLARGDLCALCVNLENDNPYGPCNDCNDEDFKGWRFDTARFMREE